MPTSCAITFRLLYTANNDRILRVNCGKFHWAKLLICVGWYIMQRQKQRLRPNVFATFFSSYIKRFFCLCNFPGQCWGTFLAPWQVLQRTGHPGFAGHPGSTECRSCLSEKVNWIDWYGAVILPPLNTFDSCSNSAGIECALMVNSDSIALHPICWFFCH